MILLFPVLKVILETVTQYGQCIDDKRTLYMNERYVLKHKNINTAIVSFTDDGEVFSIDQIIDARHLPVGVLQEGKIISLKYLCGWWNDRGIPWGRQGRENLLRVLGEKNTEALLLRGSGLSLSDHYWVVKEKEHTQTWEEINYYNNTFSAEIGDYFFHKRADKEKTGGIRNYSPDVSTKGMLKKRWMIAENGTRILIKGGSDPYYQEPCNEVIASSICGRLGIPHVPYTLDKYENEIVSVCPNMTTADIELVDAIAIYDSFYKSAFNDVSKYDHFIACCKKLDIVHSVEMCGRMIILDYIMNNKDRHFTNFGALRNSDTLLYTGLAPVFDTGTSLFCKKNADRISDDEQAELGVECFDTIHNQLDLVTDFSWFDKRKLEGLGEETFEIFNTVKDVTLERAKKIVAIMEQRIAVIDMLAQRDWNTRRRNHHSDEYGYDR
jgi:hypothetical protein